MKILSLTLILLLSGVGFLGAQEQKPAVTENAVEYLNTDAFKKNVFNYEKNKEEWVYEGKLPCLIDFYADWCKPCKMVAPVMEELAREYKGKIKIYKVNTDKEKEVAALFNIRSIPTMLFCPMQGKPQMTTGALPKETYKQVIDEFLLGIKK